MKSISQRMRVFRTFLILSGLFLCVTSLSAQYYPHPPHIDYTENFRGQYHFSPKTEWMNDINGLVYQGGKYHMIYQWGKSSRHGGYATSPDLLHWTDEGVALVPSHGKIFPKEMQNVSGEQVYSGSAVVVHGEAARKITGSPAEAMVAIYTGTKSGTCLAWSNDTGVTWHDYPGNPVANPTPGVTPRDPMVFWYEDPDRSDGDGSKWILAIFIGRGKGTDFYGSPDLINWTRLSNTTFGYECPDMFRLPLDGDTTKMKWVLADAAGYYLVGDFDGTTFTQDPGQEKLLMDVGPDFYAAQSFPMGGAARGGLPGNDSRIIQIAWNDHWNGGIGETVWNRNATFPVAVGLVTLDGKKRLTRNPIREIEKIHESTRKWEAQTVGSGNSLLNGIKSKKFDLTAEFDLAGTGATRFGFTVANRKIEYDIAAKTLLGKSMPARNSRIKIRILADWGQFAVFGDEGAFSYSEQFAFTPADSSLKLTTDGSLKLISMEFHEVARIWGPKNHETLVDDPKVTYSGAWNPVANEKIFLNKAAKISQAAGAYAEIAFTGASVSWYGLKDSSLGHADVYIDGVLAAKDIDCYSRSRRVYELFRKDGLSPGQHTIRVVVGSGKNPASSGNGVVHDFFGHSATSRPVDIESARPMSPGAMRVTAGSTGLRVSLPVRGDYDLTIADISGKVIADFRMKDSREAYFPIHGFRSGLYSISARDGTKGPVWKQLFPIGLE